MRLRVNHFWVESKDKEGKEQIVCHGKDEETGEMYHLFLTRSAASKLVAAEKKVSPEYQYRIVREVKEMFRTEWE